MGFLDSVYELLGMATILPTEEGQNTPATEEGEVSTPTTEQIRPIKFSYRPQTLETYIGQDNAKELIRINLLKIMKFKPVHILLSGFAGCGKTTLATIISNHLGYNVSYYIGGAFSYDNLFSFIRKSEQSTKPMVLFIDEIHNIDKKIAEYMYPILEDFLLPSSNRNIKPFILIGATTEKSTLLKSMKPLVDRCGCQINLEPYHSEDINQILIQYNSQVYKETITNEVFDTLSKNVRYTPRIGLSLLDDYMVCKDINRVLKVHRIVKNGFTDTDITILKHLQEINKPIGEETLAIITGNSKQEYKITIEPYLLQEGMITRTARGRLITQKGIDFLKEVEGNNEKTI